MSHIGISWKGLWMWPSVFHWKWSILGTWRQKLLKLLFRESHRCALFFDEKDLYQRVLKTKLFVYWRHLLFIVHLIDQSSNCLNLNPHIIPMIKNYLRITRNSNSRPSSCHDYSTLFKCCTTWQERNSFLDGEYHLSKNLSWAANEVTFESRKKSIPSICILYHISIVDGLDIKFMYISNSRWSHENRAKGCWSVETWSRLQEKRISIRLLLYTLDFFNLLLTFAKTPLTILELLYTCTYIITTGVTQHII